MLPFKQPGLVAYQTQFCTAKRILLNICGCITNVTPTKLSSNNNPYFDKRLKSKDGTRRIKVVENSATKRALFFEKLELKIPMMLTGLGSLKNSKSKVLVFNSNIGSRMSDCSISFKYEKPLFTEIRDIFSKTTGDTFDVFRKLKQVEEPSKVLCSTPKKELQLRNALLADESSSMKITEWGELVDQVPENVIK